MKRDYWGGAIDLLEGWKAVVVALVASIAILVLALLVSLPLAKTSSELADWVQGTGTVMAIVGGFVGILYQVAEQRRARLEDVAEIGRAAHTLASSAYELVTDRLNSALQPGKSTNQYFLRGLRTTEMISSMREFEVGSLPTSLISPFITLRACVFAINSRISELYDNEHKVEGAARRSLMDDREAELMSSIRVHIAATSAFRELNRLAGQNCRAVPFDIEIPEPLQGRSRTL